MCQSERRKSRSDGSNIELRLQPTQPTLAAATAPAWKVSLQISEVWKQAVKSVPLRSEAFIHNWVLWQVKSDTITLTKMSSFQQWKLLVLSTSHWTSVLQLEFQLSSRRREAAPNKSGKRSKERLSGNEIEFSISILRSFILTSWKYPNSTYPMILSDCHTFWCRPHRCPLSKENTTAVVEGMANQLAKAVL